MYRTPATWTLKYTVCEKSAMESSARMRQLEPQWQQKKAVNSAGNNRKHEKGINQLDKGTKSVVHESSKEFSRMLYEQL